MDYGRAELHLDTNYRLGLYLWTPQWPFELLVYTLHNQASTFNRNQFD